MWWQEMKWTAIESANKEQPVVIPLGSCEQHGRHLPLFVDTIQVTAIAERVESALRDRVLLLPPLWLGCSEHHRDFPGTISVPPSLYTQMIKAVTRSVLAAGFRRIFFLNGHGGNETPGTQALAELVGEDEQAAAAWLALASWWQVGKRALAAERLGMSTAQLSHACEYETSFMLAVRPDLVNLPAAQEGSPVLDNEWHHSERGGRVQVFRRFHRLTASGSLGHPSQATSEKGRAMVAGVSEEVIRFLEDFSTWPSLPVKKP